MKTEIKATEAGTFELWYGDTVIGTLEGAEGAGVVVRSKHPMLPQWHVAGTVEIRIASQPHEATPFPPTRTA
jgi:hypothetical protein